MKIFLKATTALALASSFAANAAAAEMLKEIGAGEGEVSLVAWAGYIERGETDKNFDWVTEFEKATGCKVNVKTAATSDEMVALMNEGGFDLVTASGDASLRLIAGKRVQPINIDLVKSWGTRRRPPARMRPGTRSTASTTARPTSGAPNVLMYNTEVFRRRRRAGTWCSRRQTCPTASRTRAACRPLTARSTLPTPRSI